MHLSPTVLSEHCSVNLVSATYMHTHTHTHTYRHTHTHVGGVTHKVGKAPWCGLSALATITLIHFSSCPTYLFLLSVILEPYLAFYPTQAALTSCLT